MFLKLPSDSSPSTARKRNQISLEMALVRLFSLMMYQTKRTSTNRRSTEQMMGDDRRTKSMCAGAPQTSPVGCVMEFRARGTRPQNADSHDTTLLVPDAGTTHGIRLFRGTTVSSVLTSA